MKITSRRILCVASAIMAMGLWPRTSQAGVVYYLGNPSGYQSALNSLGITDGNVLFNERGLVLTGHMVQGEAKSGELIDFFSNVPTHGQARVAALDLTYSAIRIAPENPAIVFQALSRNVHAHRDFTSPITIAVSVFGGGTNAVPVDVDRGNTFFGVIATGGSLFTQAILKGGVGIDDVRQVRITDSLASIGLPATPDVAEPASLLLFNVGTILLCAPMVRQWPPSRMAHPRPCAL